MWWSFCECVWVLWGVDGVVEGVWGGGVGLMGGGYSLWLLRICGERVALVCAGWMSVPKVMTLILEKQLSE